MGRDGNTPTRPTRSPTTAGPPRSTEPGCRTVAKVAWRLRRSVAHATSAGPRRVAGARTLAFPSRAPQRPAAQRRTSAHRSDSRRSRSLVATPCWALPHSGVSAISATAGVLRGSPGAHQRPAATHQAPARHPPFVQAGRSDHRQPHGRPQQLREAGQLRRAQASREGPGRCLLGLPPPPPSDERVIAPPPGIAPAQAVSAHATRCLRPRPGPVPAALWLQITTAPPAMSDSSQLRPAPLLPRRWAAANTTPVRSPRPPRPRPARAAPGPPPDRPPPGRAVPRPDAAAPAHPHHGAAPSRAHPAAAWRTNLRKIITMIQVRALDTSAPSR